MIALITQRLNVDNYGNDIDVLEKSYVTFFESIGFHLIPISNQTKDIKFYFDLKPDLIIITGGGSVPPDYYLNCKEKKWTKRDIIEYKLINEALKQNISVLGICRGMQFINGYFGGRVDKLSNLSISHKTGLNHDIFINGIIINVNHYHNDCIPIDYLAKELSLVASDKDKKTVEIFISKEKKILGVQWHPERDDFKEKEIFIELLKTILKGEI